MTSLSSGHGPSRARGLRLQRRLRDFSWRPDDESDGCGFWRSNPLANERLSLFASMVEEVLLDDPDLENAKFVILDFSAAGPKQPRTLKEIDAREIPRVSNETKLEMLSLFAEGYFLAEAELAAAPEAGRESEHRDESDKGDQPGLFDDD